MNKDFGIVVLVLLSILIPCLLPIFSLLSFFIFDSFPFHFFEEYSQILYQTGNATKVLCGWVEVFEDDYEAFVYLKEFKKIG